MFRVFPRPTFSGVASLLALVLALGGGGYAVAASSGGTGALSFDGQFSNAPVDNVITTIHGIQVTISCGTGSGISLHVWRVNSSRSFYAFGTKAEDGVLAHATLTTDGSGHAKSIDALGGNAVELSVVAASTTAGHPVKWTRFDFSGIRGTACNYHGLIIPGGPAS